MIPNSSFHSIFQYPYATSMLYHFCRVGGPPDSYVSSKMHRASPQDLQLNFCFYGFATVQWQLGKRILWLLQIVVFRVSSLGFSV